jgi:hypothetical protein
MGLITLQTPKPNTKISAGLHASNLSTLQALLNGNLDNQNVSPGANLDPRSFVGIPYKFFEQTLGINVNTLDIPAIPSGWTSILLVMSLKSTSGASDETAVNLRFNNVSSANYDWISSHASPGGGFSGTNGAAATEATFAYICGSNTAQAADFSAVVVEIPNYTGGTSEGKHFRSWSATVYNSLASSARLNMGFGVLRSSTATGAITTVQLRDTVNGIKTGSRISLYLR